VSGTFLPSMRWNLHVGYDGEITLTPDWTYVSAADKALWTDIYGESSITASYDEDENIWMFEDAILNKPFSHAIVIEKVDENDFPLCEA